MSTTKMASESKAIVDTQMASSTSSSKTAILVSTKKGFIFRPTETMDVHAIQCLLEEWALECHELPQTPNIKEGFWFSCVSISTLKVIGFVHFVHRKVGSRVYLQGAQLFVSKAWRKTAAGSLLYQGALRFWKTTKLPMVVQARWEDRGMWDMKKYKPAFVVLVREP